MRERREWRAELLAASEPAELVALAERCLEHGEQPQVVREPEVGMAVLQVREPVEESRFILGEVLVTQAEIARRGVRGWSIRIGDDRLAALAGAVCDAETEADGPLAADVEALCRRTERGLAADAAAEWEELAPTVVAFEELD